MPPTLSGFFGALLACSPRPAGAPAAPVGDPQETAGLTAGSSDSAPSGPADTGPADTDPADTGPWTTGSPLVFSRRPENILVITLDTTRRDYLGRFSGDPEATPTLDALMADGLVLEDHRSCSDWTWESLICVQSGRLPYRLGFPWSGETGGALSFPEDAPLISQALYDLGFQTSLVSAQSYLGGGLGLERGFQRVSFQSDAPAATLVDRSEEALAELDPSRPWYLDLHFLDPHHLYTPPPEYLGALDDLAPITYDLSTDAGYLAMMNNWGPMGSEQRALVTAHLQARYRGELRYLDDQLARLLELLDRGGWLDRTLLLLWTDHGEQLYQHDQPNHGGGLYDEESRAAAVFWSRDLLTPGAWTGPTSHPDLWPTALDAMGLETALGMEGDVLGSRPAEAPRFAVHYRGPDTDQAVVLGDQKLIYDWAGRAQRYQLDTDPGETADLYDPDDPESAALWALLGPEAEQIAQAAGGAAPTAP